MEIEELIEVERVVNRRYETPAGLLAGLESDSLPASDAFSRMNYVFRTGPAACDRCDSFDTQLGQHTHDAGHFVTLGNRHRHRDLELGLAGRESHAHSGCGAFFAAGRDDGDILFTLAVEDDNLVSFT